MCVPTHAEADGSSREDFAAATLSSSCHLGDYHNCTFIFVYIFVKYFFIFKTTLCCHLGDYNNCTDASGDANYCTDLEFKNMKQEIFLKKIFCSCWLWGHGIITIAIALRHCWCNYCPPITFPLPFILRENWKKSSLMSELNDSCWLAVRIIAIAPTHFIVSCQQININCNAFDQQININVTLAFEKFLLRSRSWD